MNNKSGKNSFLNNNVKNTSESNLSNQNPLKSIAPIINNKIQNVNLFSDNNKSKNKIYPVGDLFSPNFQVDNKSFGKMIYSVDKDQKLSKGSSNGGSMLNKLTFDSVISKKNVSSIGISNENSEKTRSSNVKNHSISNSIINNNDKVLVISSNKLDSIGKINKIVNNNNNKNANTTYANNNSQNPSQINNNFNSISNCSNFLNKNQNLIPNNNQENNINLNNNIFFNGNNFNSDGFNIPMISNLQPHQINVNINNYNINNINISNPQPAKQKMSLKLDNMYNNSKSNSNNNKETIKNTNFELSPKMKNLNANVLNNNIFSMNNNINNIDNQSLANLINDENKENRDFSKVNKNISKYNEYLNDNKYKNRPMTNNKEKEKDSTKFSANKNILKNKEEENKEYKENRINSFRKSVRNSSIKEKAPTNLMNPPIQMREFIFNPSNSNQKAIDSVVKPTEINNDSVINELADLFSANSSKDKGENLSNNKNNSFLNNSENEKKINNEENEDLLNINFNKIFFSEKTHNKNLNSLNYDKYEQNHKLNENVLNNNINPQMKANSNKIKGKEEFQSIENNEIRKDINIVTSKKLNLNFFSNKNEKPKKNMKIKIENIENTTKEAHKLPNNINDINNPLNNQLFRGSSLSEFGCNGNTYKINNVNNINNFNINKFAIKGNSMENENKGEEKASYLNYTKNPKDEILLKQKSLKISKQFYGNITNSNENQVQLDGNNNIPYKNINSHNLNRRKRDHSNIQVEGNFNNCEFNIESLIENKNFNNDNSISLRNSILFEDYNVIYNLIF